MVTFETFIDGLDQAGEQALNIMVLEYLALVHVPVPIGELFFTWAQRKWSNGAKRYRDWPAVILRALKEDWHHLWRFGADGSCYLTTAGEQLAREGQASTEATA